MTGVRVDSSDLDAYARALRVTEATMMAHVGDQLARIGRPLGMRAITEGAGEMPQSGGLGALIESGARVDVDKSIRGRLAEVGIGLSGGADLASLDRGELRHKVFDRPERDVTWVDQAVPAEAFSRALENQMDQVTEAVARGVHEALQAAARHH